MKTDLINLVISNSTLTNSKYHENVWMINYIASKTKFHDKINSSDNIVFQNILDFNRSLESFVKYNDESKQYDFFINDEKLSKLLWEYRLEDTWDRFIKKVILANKLIEAGKSKMVIESLKVDISNIKDVYYHPNEIKQNQLKMFEINIK